jgi:hypothetical protein
MGPFRVAKEWNGAIKIEAIDEELPRNMHDVINTKNARRFWQPVIESETRENGRQESEADWDSEKEDGDEVEDEEELNEEEGEEKEVEKIENHRKTSTGWKLLTRFKGEEEARWIPIENLVEKAGDEWVVNEQAKHYIERQNKKGARIPTQWEE